jgi:hypothetical protein
MRRQNFLTTNAALLIIAVAFLVTSAKAAPTERVLYNFKYKNTGSLFLRFESRASL